MSLTDGDSFDLVVGAGPGEGLEAWRRLHRRWDPLTTGRARSLLREILSPSRAKAAKLAELQGAVERLEDLMRRYCMRKESSTGNRHSLAEDIKMAALESLLPEELEKHCQLNRARLDSYEKLREEVVLYAEARGYNGPRNVGPNKTQPHRGDDPMDVGGLTGKGKDKNGKGKGKGRGDDKGKGKTKTEDTCWNCGKRGHHSKDCWSKPQTPGKGHSGKKGNEKGGKHQQPKGKGKVKDAGALDQDAGGEQAHEVGVFDLCSVTSPMTDNMEKGKWLTLNLDTGAGATVWPSSASYGERCEHQASRTFKTATGEICTSEGRYKVKGKDKYGTSVKFEGDRAPVHKSLSRQVK
eukprot:6465990-Amphidinium_carterae.1